MSVKKPWMMPLSMSETLVDGNNLKKIKFNIPSNRKKNGALRRRRTTRYTTTPTQISNHEQLKTKKKSGEGMSPSSKE